MRKLTAAGCGLWIIGLIIFIVGLNLTGNVKDLMTVAGSIIFLTGLGITGVVWMKTKNEPQNENKNAADQ